MRIPWRLKILAKILIRRLPIPYGFWKSLRLFEHGCMQKPEYAYGVFLKHLQQAGPPPGFTCLELGPGDSLFTALAAHAHGAGGSILVDSGDYASRDLEGNLRMVDYLESRGLAMRVSRASVDGLLSDCRGRYLTGGLKSLQDLPAGSVDFIFSHAVLEHVRRREFDATLRECRRILKPGGVMSHQVDLEDHLAGSLNNLRFRPGVWESDFMADSGFYTNRLRMAEILRSLEQAGFRTEVDSVARWERLPVARSRMAQPFSGMAEDELRVHAFSFRAWPKQEA